jgi:hypothetical protein
MKNMLLYKLMLLLLVINLAQGILSDSSSLKKYITKSGILIESGSYLGNGIQRFLDLGFHSIYSVELAYHYFEHCLNRFSDKKDKVHLYYGDSGDKFKDILASITGQVVFWLDGHYSEGDTAKGIENSPILRELETISKHHIKNHTILIDDVRQFGKEEFDYVTLTDVMKRILDINPSYKFTLEHGYINYDILVAQIFDTEHQEFLSNQCQS